MSESTFKNIQDISFEETQGRWIVTDFDWPTSWARTFYRDGWDMEVTFTRKETPLAVGDHIRDDRGDTAIVLAIDGDEVWLKYYGTFNFRATGNLDECTKISD